MALKKTYKKKTLGLTATQKKAVTILAKKATMGVAETKSYLNVHSQSMFSDLVYAHNIMFPIAQGSNSENVIGEKFFLKNIRLRGLLQSSNGTTPSNEKLFVRLALIRTKKNLTASASSITSTDVYRAPVSTYIASQAFLDLHKIDVVCERKFTVEQPQFDAISTGTAFDINCQINKTLFFDQDNSGYLKDKNYYVIFTCHKSGGASATIGTIRYQYMINYKDV